MCMTPTKDPIVTTGTPASRTALCPLSERPSSTAPPVASCGRTTAGGWRMWAFHWFERVELGFSHGVAVENAAHISIETGLLSKTVGTAPLLHAFTWLKSDHIWEQPSLRAAEHSP